MQSVIDRLNAAKGSDEYRIGEIYLSATPENQAQIVANARNIIQQIQQGGSFQAYARQFSEASTAAVGGDLGWIRPAQLPAELAQAAAEMQVGQIAGPIETVGGVSIIYVMDKRKVLTADPRDALLSLKQLSVLFPQGTTKEQASAKAAQFAAAVKEIKGCGQANEIGARIGADVVDNDNVKVRDLPPQLQEILLNLQVGETTPPFGSITDGVRVLVVCGRDDPTSANAPNPTAIATVDKRARGTPPGAEVWTRAMAALKQARPFGICYVQNNLPYARRIETGWSQQSPMGVLALTLAELRSEIYEPEELANV